MAKEETLSPLGAAESAENSRNSIQEVQGKNKKKRKERIRQIAHPGPYYFKPSQCRDRIRIGRWSITEGNIRPQYQGAREEAASSEWRIGASSAPRPPPNHNYRCEFEWSPKDPIVCYCVRVHKVTGERLPYDVIAAELVMQLPEVVRTMARKLRMQRLSFRELLQYLHLWPAQSQRPFLQFSRHWEALFYEETLREVIPEDYMTWEEGRLGEQYRIGEKFCYHMHTK